MKLYGEILILTLLILSNGRCLVINKPHRDPLVMLAPLSFLLSSLSLWAFSVDAFSLILVLLSFLVLISNFHALFRYTSHLVIDHYSPLMKTWAIITIALSALTLIMVLIFKPVEVSARKIGVTETKLEYTGSFAYGFSQRENFDFCNVFLSEFSLVPDAPGKTNIAILMPDKRGDTESYKPFLLLLAKAGHTVVSADFFTKDVKWLHTIEESRLFRRMGLSFRSHLNPQRFDSQREFYTFNFTKEFDALLNLLPQKYGPDCRYFLITDNLSYTAACDIQKQNPELISGVFDLSSVPEYKTPGLGFIQETNPLKAKSIKLSKDKELTDVNACVDAVSKAIKEIR